MITMIPPLKAWPVWGVRIVRNALIDVRYGGLLGGDINSRYPHLGHVETTNSDYVELAHIFEGRIKDSDVLVDVGCGKGRVINYWLRHAPHNRLIGIELNEVIANKTRRRLHRYKNVTILAGDAVENIPADGTQFFLFNPFAAPILEAFKNRLMSVFGKGSGITILYDNPKHVDVFLDDPEWTVKIVKVGGPSTFPFAPLAVVKMSGSPQAACGPSADLQLPH